MAQILSADEFADVQAQLSKDFAWLLLRDPAVEVRRWRCCWTRSRTGPAATSTCRSSSGVVLMVASPGPPTTKSAYRIMRPPAPKARSRDAVTCDDAERRTSRLFPGCPWLSPRDRREPL
jgi:hypothetical protein